MCPLTCSPPLLPPSLHLGCWQWRGLRHFIFMQWTKLMALQSDWRERGGERGELKSKPSQVIIPRSANQKNKWENTSTWGFKFTWTKTKKREKKETEMRKLIEISARSSGEEGTLWQWNTRWQVAEGSRASVAKVFYVNILSGNLKLNLRKGIKWN